MEAIFTGEFKQALNDYAWMLDNKYPRKSVMKLVGDRYMLNSTQRVMLNRGIFSVTEAEERKQKKTNLLPGRTIYFDTYNVLFTLANYLLGRLVFISCDGFVRDTGEIYGKLYRGKILMRSLNCLFEFLNERKPSDVIFLVDEPISGSELLLNDLKHLINKCNFHGNAKIEQNPDEKLILLTEGIIATSDSEIIDETECQVTDIPMQVLMQTFNPYLPDLSKYLVRKE